uniref:PPIase cyclophilin-type domain-containing protein n=1 Tax=Arcella intermedia TaxID=1963864 RepID=A0A6B2LG42_9EUKA
MCKTTASPKEIRIEVYPDWAPIGSDRFLELVRDNYFTKSPFFRVVKGFLVQFGIPADPSKWKEWHDKGPINDDPPKGVSFKRGYLSFAGYGEDSRTTELFVAYSDENGFGNTRWEVPFGVVQDMDVFDQINDEYGDVPPYGQGPDQQQLYLRGNAYLTENFPKMDYISYCSIESEQNSFNTEISILNELPSYESKGKSESYIFFRGEVWLLFIGIGYLGFLFVYKMNGTTTQEYKIL